MDILILIVAFVGMLIIAWFEVYMWWKFASNATVSDNVLYGTLMTIVIVLTVTQINQPELAGSIVLIEILMGLTVSAYMLHRMQLAWDCGKVTRQLQICALILGFVSTIPMLIIRRIKLGYFMPPLSV